LSYLILFLCKLALNENRNNSIFVDMAIELLADMEGKWDIWQYSRSLWLPWCRV